MSNKATIKLTAEESNDFYNDIRKYMLARQRLDSLNEESKKIREYLRINGAKISNFLNEKQMKGTKQEGHSLRSVTKTIKPKPTSDNVFDAIVAMYGDDCEIIRQVRQYVNDKYVIPKQKQKTVLKIVKLKSKSAAQPTPDQAS